MAAAAAAAAGSVFVGSHVDHGKRAMDNPTNNHGIG